MSPGVWVLGAQQAPGAPVADLQNHQPIWGGGQGNW